ncbi:MAG: biosynthetic peptidoglycan transglycosylase, partial [Myxococcota bacterium]
VRKRLSRARERLRGDVEDRLGAQLARTAPRAAVVAATVLAAVSPPARAAVGLGWGAALAVGLGALGWFAAPSELAATSAPVSIVAASVGRAVAPSIDAAPDTLELPPAHVQHAFLAAEDARFRSHGAVDWRAIGRAAAATAGGDRQGGSTVTQQLAKRLISVDWPDPTLGRKLVEVWVAAELERRWTKDQILGAYLGSVYLGHGAVGVDAAARTYFGVSADALTLGQAALLAGLPAAPVANDPIDAPERARARQRQVLDAMERHGWATQAQVEAALAEPLP